jgi:hypothetical protein
LSDALTMDLAPGQIENGVLIGEDGMLFLAGGAHAVLDQVTGARPLPDDCVRAFRANHLARRRHCERRDRPFLHVLTPDKQSFLADLWPLRDRPFRRLGAMLLDRLGADGEGVDYPVDLLAGMGRKAASTVDTHYTDRASILLAARVAERLTGEAQDGILAGLLAGLTGTRTHAGDLGSKLDPVRRATDVSHVPSGRATRLSNDLSFGNNGIIDIWLNPDARYASRLLFMGDSFGRHMACFLPAFFREILYFRSPHFHAELVDLFRPHHVVTQNVERYLTTVRPDGQRIHFMLLPHLKGVPYQPPPAFVETLGALLAVGRPAYARFVRDTFGTEPDA